MDRARYARIYVACVRNCLVRELEFRTNFVFGAAAGVLWAVLSMLMVGMVFGNVRQVAGWDLDRMFLLVGTFVLIGSVTGVLFRPNMNHLSELVNRGDLDFVLMKPISSQFLVSIRYVDLRDLPELVVGVIYVLIGIGRLGLRPGLVDVFLYLVLIACACLSVYAVWFMTVTFALWTGRVSNIAHLIVPFLDLARIPTDVFRGLLGVLFTFAIPIALIATLPSQALLGVIHPAMAPYQVVLTAVLLWASHRFWGYSLRHYSSASS